MTVGLVIVTWNAEAFIRRTLAAVAAQTRPPDEVIVFDNCSTDGTWQVLETATRAWTVPVRLVQAGANLGFAAGNNRAVATLSSPCDLVALLNPDAFPDPGWLEALLRAADAHPGAASFASRLMVAERPGVLDGAGDVCHVSGVVWRRFHGQRLADTPDALVAGPVFSACAAAALYRRADWDSVGGFDERFFCYVEDVDLGFRLQRRDRGCWYVPDAVAHHVGSATSGVHSAFSVYHGHRNLEWMLLKNMPLSLLLRYLPLHLLTIAAGVVRFARLGRAGTYLRAKWDALRGARRMVRARRVAATDLDASAVLKRLERSSLARKALSPRARGGWGAGGQGDWN